MIQINLITIGEFVKKHLGWIAFAILLLFTFNCGGNSDSKEIRKERDKENKAYEKKIDSLENVNKSKDKIIAKSEKKVVEYKKKNDLLIAEIAKEKSKGEKAIAIQKKYDLKDWKKFYQEKSGYGDKDISIANNTLNFTRAPLISIGGELVKADVVKAELKITKEILIQTQAIVVEKDKIIEIGNEKIVNLEKVVEADSFIKSNLNQNISSLQNDLKKANRPKAKTIIVSSVLGIIIGGIIFK